MSDKAAGVCTMKAVVISVTVVVVVGVALGAGLGVYYSKNNGNNGGGSSSLSLPYITPPVKAACPASLRNAAGSQSSHFKTQTLDPTIITSRFFNPSGGPTNLFNILEGVDARLQGINQRLSQFGCMFNNNGAFYQLNAWVPTPTFFVQCSEEWGTGSSGFDQWGQLGNTTYLYSRGGDGIIAAMVVGNGSFANVATVTIWTSVGIVNRNGSHGVMQIFAEPAFNIFEMSVAGAGIGFCGAQLRSTSTVMNVTGSADGPGCATTDSSCTAASSISTPATCGPSANIFVLPALGRQAYGTNAASMYPGGAADQVVLSDTGNDATFFGPSSPTVTPYF